MKFAPVGSLFAAWMALALFQPFAAAEDRKAEDKPTADKKPGPQTVKKILDVKYAIQTINPPNLVVTAEGQVSTGGFDKDKVQLLRVIYAVPPADGIQDYFLVAVPPSGPVTQVISTVTATDTWKGYTKEAPWLKGIRVHGIEDGIVVKMIAVQK